MLMRFLSPAKATICEGYTLVSCPSSLVNQLAQHRKGVDANIMFASSNPNV